MVWLLRAAEEGSGSGRHNLTEVNIEQDENAAVRVMEVNGGNQTVPTLEFADGSALTNPSVAQVRDKLAELA
jgi:mycoredoxin